MSDLKKKAAGSVSDMSAMDFLPASLSGHTTQRQMLNRLLKSDRLPSTMLFAGAQGIGKRQVALELARSIYCLNSSINSYGGCNPEQHSQGHATHNHDQLSCKNCRNIISNNFPDLITHDCADKDKFDLDTLREVLHTTNMKPFLGGSRVIILDNAETLSIQACNLLLKSLEEPRPNNHFILICSSPSVLPQTLLSRCQVWFFDLLSETIIKEILERNQIGTNLQELAQLADGSVANITSLEERTSDWHDIHADLSSIASGSLDIALALAAELAKDKDHLKVKLNLLRIAARYRLRSSANQQEYFIWSTFILELLVAERLIFDRNLGAAYVLNLILSKLTTPHTFTRSLASDTLLQNIAV